MLSTTPLWLAMADRNLTLFIIFPVLFSLR